MQALYKLPNPTQTLTGFGLPDSIPLNILSSLLVGNLKEKKKSLQ